MGGRRRLQVIAGAVVVAVAVGFVAATLADRWEESRAAVGDADIGWLAAAFVPAAAGMVWIAWSWRWAARLVGGDMSSSAAVRWYVVGELGKYVPGGVWPVVGRAELARRGGMGRRAAYGSVALSLAAVYLANAVFVAVLAGEELAIAVVPVGLLGLELGRRLAPRFIDIEMPTFPALVALVLRYLPAWALIGTATWCVARALVPAADAEWIEIAPAAALSWLVGFLVVPAPGGVGVREAAFVAAVTLSSGLAATVAVVARLVFVLVDAALAAAATAWEVGRR